MKTRFLQKLKMVLGKEDVLEQVFSIKLRHPRCVRIQYDGTGSTVKTQLWWWSFIIK